MNIKYLINNRFFIICLFILLYNLASNVEICYGQSDSVKSIVAELNKYIYPVAADPLSNTDTDLAPFDKLAGAKIIGLGEATHGTKEFFQMKHRLFKYYVEKHGYKVFGFEADMGECIYIDRFICKGTGTINQVMNKMHFWTWKTEEVKELILWMKAYNSTRSPQDQIHFMGFDCQYKNYNPDLIREYLANANIYPPVYISRILDEIQTLDLSDASSVTVAQYNAYSRKCDSLTTFLENKKSRLISFSNNIEFEQIKRLIIQTTQVIGITILKGVHDRDYYMAQNAVWMSNLYGTNSKIVIWAHNAHIAKDPNFMASAGSMGYNLLKSLGENYKTAGFSFNYGSFQAVGLDNATKKYTGLHNFSITEAPLANSSNYIFSFAEPKTFAVFMQDISISQTLNNWLNATNQFFEVGAVYSPEYRDTYYYEKSLASLFDVIIHFQTTNAAAGYVSRATDSNETTSENFTLFNNFPNPFNPVTNIKFFLPKESGVKLTVYDAIGKRIAVLANRQMSQGTHIVQWDASNFASGVYFLRIEADNYKTTNKMLLMK